MEAAQTSGHQLVDQPVVDRRGLPAHAAQKPDALHALTLCGSEPVPVDPVVRPLGAQRCCQRQGLSRLAGAAALLQGAAQAEEREIVHGVAVDDSLELAGSRLVAAGAEVGASQGLADRALLRLHCPRLLERYRRRREIPVLQQVRAAHVEVVDLLAAFLGGHAGAPVLLLSSSTASTMAAATAVFGPRGTALAPAAVTVGTSVLSDSDPT